MSSDFSGAISVRVAHVCDFSIRESGQFVRVLFAANAAADDGRGNLVVGARGVLFRGEDGQGKGRRRGRGENGVFKKLTASDGIHRFSIINAPWQFSNA